MEFVGRTRELGLIRSVLDRAEPSVLRVRGMRGVGKSALVRQALDAFAHRVLVVPALPEPLQIRALTTGIAAAGGDDAPIVHTAPELAETWTALFGAAAERARPGRAPFVLVLDDAHRLDESRARHHEALVHVLRGAREARRTLHVILVGPGTDEQTTKSADGEAGPPIEILDVEPLPFRHAARLLPGTGADALLRAYGVFGGIPRVLRYVDSTVKLETNVRRLLLDPEAPLGDVPGQWLERDLQVTSRYNAVLSTLARGERDWGELRPGVPDLTSAGQLAPYVRRLETLGLVTVRRSLDAAPTSRASRYTVSDPFLAFWYRFVFPSLGTRPGKHATDARIQAMRDGLDDHLESAFPRICRQHMRHDAIETLGANARECGSLWGQGYDIPVAGILSSGAAFYGACAWHPTVRGENPLGVLDAQTRETRYGFGRQHRLRLLFTRAQPPRWLERSALRRDQTLLIGPEGLLGDLMKRPTAAIRPGSARTSRSSR